MILWSWMVNLYSENLQISCENKNSKKEKKKKERAQLKIDQAEIKALEHIVKITDPQSH